MAFAAASHLNVTARNYADRRSEGDGFMNSARLSTGRLSSRQISARQASARQSQKPASRTRFRQPHSILDNYRKERGGECKVETFIWSTESVLKTYLSGVAEDIDADIQKICNKFDKICRNNPDLVPIHWIRVINLDQYVADSLSERFEINSDDILSCVGAEVGEVGVSATDNYLWFSTKLQGVEEEGNVLSYFTEHMYIFYVFEHNTFITAQQSPLLDATFENILEKLEIKKSRIRQSSDSSFMVYAFLDAIVDYSMSIIGEVEEAMPAMIEEIHEKADLVTWLGPSTHILRQPLTITRSNAWAMRELITELKQDEFGVLSETTQEYLSSVYVHCESAVEIITATLKSVGDIDSLYQANLSARTDTTVKLLTTLSLTLMPSAFITGIYGMNWSYFPETLDEQGYFYSWYAMGLLIGFALSYMYVNNYGWPVDWIFVLWHWMIHGGVCTFLIDLMNSFDLSLFMFLFALLNWRDFRNLPLWLKCRVDQVQVANLHVA